MFNIYTKITMLLLCSLFSLQALSAYFIALESEDKDSKYFNFDFNDEEISFFDLESDELVFKFAKKEIFGIKKSSKHKTLSVAKEKNEELDFDSREFVSEIDTKNLLFKFAKKLYENKALVKNLIKSTASTPKQNPDMKNKTSFVKSCGMTLLSPFIFVGRSVFQGCSNTFGFCFKVVGATLAITIGGMIITAVFSGAPA